MHCVAITFLNCPQAQKDNSMVPCILLALDWYSQSRRTRFITSLGRHSPSNLPSYRSGQRRYLCFCEEANLHSPPLSERVLSMSQLARLVLMGIFGFMRAGDITLQSVSPAQPLHSHSMTGQSSDSSFFSVWQHPQFQDWSGHYRSPSWFEGFHN